MLITIFSDASLCPDTRKGGWAAWLKSENGTVRGGGILHRHLNDTSIAEGMAVVNALHIGMKEGLIRPGDAILVNTDNDAVMDVLQGRARRRLKAQGLLVEEVAGMFAHLVGMIGTMPRWRHVKAHVGVIDRRSSVNDWCDEKARGHMRRGRRGAPHWSRAPECAILPEDEGVETSTQERKRRRRATAA